MVKKSIDAKVRPLSNTSLEKASLLGAGRVYVSKDSLLSLTGALENGKACMLEKLDDGQGGVPVRREAALWNMPDKNVSPNIAMMTRAFQEAAGLKLGDQVRISMCASEVPEAHEVVVQDITDGEPAAAESRAKYAPGWEFAISLSIGEICSLSGHLDIPGNSTNIKQSARSRYSLAWSLKGSASTSCDGITRSYRWIRDWTILPATA
jgi:AAA family ATPase